jgi:hypothetical protein
LNQDKEDTIFKLQKKLSKQEIINKDQSKQLQNNKQIQYDSSPTSPKRKIALGKSTLPM